MKTCQLILDPLLTFVASGECVVEEGWVHPREQLQVFKLIVAYRGTFVLKVEDLGEVTLKQGDMLLIPPDTSWEGISKACQGDSFWWLFFSNSVTANASKTVVNFPRLKTLCNALEARKLYENLINRQFLHPDQKLGLCLDVTQIVTHLWYDAPDADTAKKTDSNSAGKHHDIANRIIIHLKKNIAKELSIEEIAEHFKMNSVHLRRVFKKATGHTPIQYHMLLRIDEAKSRLSKDETQVSQIAYKLGFDDVSRFSKIFKKITGYWPTEFRGRQTASCNTDGTFYPFVKRL